MDPMASQVTLHAGTYGGERGRILIITIFCFIMKDHEVTGRASNLENGKIPVDKT